MEKNKINAIINQVKKYNLSDLFKSKEDLEAWVLSLSSEQITNFLSLNLSSAEVKEIGFLLIDRNLLAYHDYLQRIIALSRLKGIRKEVLAKLTKEHVLANPKFYNDLRIINSGQIPEVGINAMSSIAFINSIYHEEDLRLIVNAREKFIAEVLADVAKNKNSIASPYHEIDMKIIARASFASLSKAPTSAGYLATNPVSLQDPNHIKNMQILVDNYEISEFLYPLMTQVSFITGKHYHEEINALLNAKNRLKLWGLYYYMAKPDANTLKNKTAEDFQIEKEIIQKLAWDAKSGKSDSMYLRNIQKIQELDDDLVLPFLSLIMNSNFQKSTWKEFDLCLLDQVKDREIFKELCAFMQLPQFMENPYHMKDALLLSKTSNKVSRLLLTTYMENIIHNDRGDINRELIMHYIARFEFDYIPKGILKKIIYFVFKKDTFIALRPEMFNLLHEENVSKERIVDFLNELVENLTMRFSETKLDKKPLPGMLLQRLFPKDSKSRIN